MKVQTNKNAIWIEQNDTKRLIWEDDLTDDMSVVDLTLTTIDADLINQIRSEITGEKYESYLAEASTYEDIEDPEAYARGLIEENVQDRIKAIREDNVNKTILKEKTISPEKDIEIISNDRDDDMFISSINYLPDFLQDKAVFKDATKLLDVLISNYSNEEIKQIYEAYCDTLYKWSNYQKLSYGAKVSLLQEKGFQYLLDLLLHMYDNEYNKLCDKYDAGEITEIPLYNDFVKERSDEALTKITMLFNLLYVLKGKTLGLELALELIDTPPFLYLPWDIIANNKGDWISMETLPLPGGDIEVKRGDYYSVMGNAGNYYIFNGVAWHPVSDIDYYKTPREPFTAVLEIYGLEDEKVDETLTHKINADLQRRITTFVRSYMLPYIDVTLRFTADVAPVVNYPSGAAIILNAAQYYDYEEDGVRKQYKLEHFVSDEGWRYAGVYPVEQVDFGTNGVEAFKGSITLTKSYVQDPDGTKHYLYGTTPKLSDYVTGTAVDKVQNHAIIDNYDNDYLSVLLERYVDIDIETGNQINPYYDDNEFVRDTVIKFYSFLTVGAIHVNKTIDQMQEVFIKDFEHEYKEGEVWLGRQTSLECVSGWNRNVEQNTLIQWVVDAITPELFNEYSTLRQSTINEYVALYKQYINENTTYYRKQKISAQMAELEQQYPGLKRLSQMPSFYEFETTPYGTREQTGTESHHLVFCEEQLDENYTGIGDIGILGANDYFIYNGMLLYHSDRLRQIGSSKKWTDIGASHAVSEIYYTPAICDGSLEILHLGQQFDIVRDPNHLLAYRSHSTAYKTLSVENLDNESINSLQRRKIIDFRDPWGTIDEEYWDDQELTHWENITGYINEHYTAFGICNGRLYKLYQNPLYGKEDQPFLCYQIMDNDQGWTYITGCHYSNTYEAYGIKNGRLYRISDQDFTELTLEPESRETDISNVTYTREQVEENVIDTIVYNTFTTPDTIQITYGIEYGTTLITDIKFNGESQEFIRDGLDYISDNILINYFNGDLIIKASTQLYIVNIHINESPQTYILTENTEIVGWEGDCISRYHHSNSDYTTYGICNGILYAITADKIKVLDNTRPYSAICGFYNQNSPRTFAYAISEGNLYQIMGNSTQRDPNTGLFISPDIILKDSSMYWREIHGCTTATNNFAVGFATVDASTTLGYIYRINANNNTPAQIDNRPEWKSVYGRVTTSTSNTANCYGYAFRVVDGRTKLYEITRDGLSIVSGFWKEDGLGQIVNLEDYNISGIKVNLPDGSKLNSVQEIKEAAIYPNTILSDYDIYVIYNTTGFNNYQRYNIRTELSDTNYQYTHPSECRVNVYENNCYDLFDTETGLITGFVQKNVIVHGSDIILGPGTAYRFKETNTYFELPFVEDLQEIVISFECTIDSNLNPVILDENNKSGIFYGKYNNEYGIFIKYQENDVDVYTNIINLQEGETGIYTVRFVGDNICDIYIVGQGKVFSSSTANNKYVYVPKYLGGNGIEFGDPTIYLQDSYIQGNKRIDLFENNNKYFSIETLQQDLVEYLITDNSQNTQKVIEVKKANNEVLELSMDELYSTLDIDSEAENLIVYTDYNVNRLQHDPYEGITTSTLEFAGAYEMDPQKITSNIPLNTDTYNICDFNSIGIAKNLNGENKVYFNLSTDFNNPIKIITGSNVENQIFFTTEENEAYTNRYLLTTDINADSDLSLNTVSSGIIYELNTNTPGVRTRVLVYNNTSFSLDETKINNYSLYYFDDYEATLKFSPIYTWDSTTSHNVYVDEYVTIYLNEEDDDQNYAETRFKVLPDMEGQKFFTIDGNEFLSKSQDTYYKINTTKQYIGYNQTYLTEINPEPLEKDQLHYKKGKCWNFNETSYFTLNTFAQGLVLCVETDDDTSKDQGIFQFGDNGFGIKDNVWALFYDGVINTSTVTAWDKSRAYIKFEDDNIYFSKNNKDWIILFENAPIAGSLQIGYADVGLGYLPFNGAVNLARSYIFDNGNKRLYNLSQSSIVSLSYDDISYTNLQTIQTDYVVDEITIGHEFTGKLDCYYSKLLKSYDLQWVENRQDLNTAIKTALQENDRNYNPELDRNIYDITEYGIQLNETPNRWQQVIVTYTTTDVAYYMQPDTTYEVKIDVIEDRDSGKLDAEVIGNPIFVNGIMTSFPTGHCETLLSGQYIVLKLELLDIQDQVICGYSDSISQSIFIEDGIVKYFDDTNKYNLFNAQIGDVYIKLYSTEKNIEYSLDGENWIDTNVPAQFTGYDTFNLGVGYVNGNVGFFHGKINLGESYIQEETGINYLFTYYKKLIPQIYDGQWHHLTLEPLLTVKDTVVFASNFDGEIDMFNSGLCLSDTKYWQANCLIVYDWSLRLKCIEYNSSLPEFEQNHLYSEGDRININSKSFEILDVKNSTNTVIPDTTKVRVGDIIYASSNKVHDTVIRDSVKIDNEMYRIENEIVHVNLDDLYCHVTGVPRIGDIINLTYNSWYLFREKNTLYEFKVTNGENTVISYGKKGDKEHKIYITENQNLLVNTGYQFGGTLSVKDSTRALASLCEYKIWYTYIIKYKKDTETEWSKWVEFIKERSNAIHERMGYQLHGTHYLQTSWLHTNIISTPFITFYNYEYIEPKGQIEFSLDGLGTVTRFTTDSYLQMIMNKLVDGSKIRYWMYTGSDISGQGVSTFIKTAGGYFHSTEDDTILNRLRPNRLYIMDYFFDYIDLRVKDVHQMFISNMNETFIKKFRAGDRGVTIRILGYAIGQGYQPKLATSKKVTLIPCNLDIDENNPSYYVTTQEQADRISIYYRKVGFLNSSGYSSWVQANFEKKVINYFGDELDIYVAEIDPANSGFQYYRGEKIEFKVVSDITTYQTIIPFTSMFLKQRAIFED